ncbi:helix-turn-helix transcriptional regulator [Alkalihalobacterium bogoriense]|uniref:helix-turn-helix transcriptional regulator n=1 Tax=Alkalihalobacterium bogoriense TaxID=246272 RepID=UPI000554F4F8|nr:metalloregulator ArsR/SmtB family transcription factor [Alkalihalobacterium bogoriense]
MAGTSTREIIVDLLKRHQQLSVTELAKKLDITEMAVRRHLHSLQKEEVVTSKLVRQAMGRPTQFYSLTMKGEHLFPRRYAPFTIGILQDVEEVAGKEMIDQLFESRRQRLLVEYKPLFKGKSFQEKVSQLVSLQNEQGYMVDVKEDDEQYHITEYNCPISEIAKQYPVACSCEKKLFQELLETDEISCRECMAIDKTSYCHYVVKKNKDR